MARAKRQWGWAGIRAALPPSVASRETPQHMCPQECQETSPERLASSAQPSSPPPGLMWSVSQPCFLWGVVRIAVRKLGLNCLGPNSEISLFPSLLTFSCYLRKADSCSEMFLRPRKWPGFQRVGPASWRMTAKTEFIAVPARPALGPGSLCLLGPSSSTLLLLYFLLTYQTEIGLLYKNLPENIMYERHTPHVFMF